MSPAVCLASGASDAFVARPAAPVFDSRGGDESLTVAWIAREGAIRGYAVRVACAADRVACEDREWFVERHVGAELSSYVVHVRVPAGATMVRVGLEAVDQHGRRVPVAERYVPQAPERLRGTRRTDDSSPPTLGTVPAAGSLLGSQPVLLASLEQRDRAFPHVPAAAGARVALHLSSRGPPATA